MLGPGALDDVEPLLRIIVAVVVLALRDAEHLELALVPADHEVEAEAALADVVGGDELLGGDQGMKQRRVHGAEHGDALGRRQQAAGPGHGLERRAVKVGVAAVALPAADRQHEVDAGLRPPCARASGSPASCADQRSGTLVAERPDEQLAPKMPIFSALALYIAERSGSDPVRLNMAGTGVGNVPENSTPSDCRVEWGGDLSIYA